MKYLIFSFLRSGNEIERGVEFHHLVRNAINQNSAESGSGSDLMGMECLSTRFPGSTVMYGIQREAKNLR